MTDKEDVTKKSGNQPLDDETLEKLAVEELMREAVQGAARAEIVGPSGWIKSPQQKTNKRFLANTLRHAVSSNRYHQSRSSSRHSYPKSPKREFPPKPTITKDKSNRKH